jgi:hypothetical protein
VGRRTTKTLRHKKEIATSGNLPVKYHGDMFCHNPEETVVFMQDVRVPRIAFKVLAAGPIPPEERLTYAFEGGADFICLGMFDYQVTEDTMLARKAIAASKDRKRPWFG